MSKAKSATKKNAHSTPPTQEGKPSGKKASVSKSAAAPPRHPATVKVTVDLALQEKWKALLDRLVSAKREGAGAFDEQWEAIGAIVDHDPPLYLAGGFSTVRDFLERHVGENERTARRFIRVAKYASPAEEAKFGISKLDRAIAYVEAKTGGPVKDRLPVAFDKLKVPIEKDGKTTNVLLENARVEDIEAATRKLVRAEGKEPEAKVSPLVKAVTSQLKSKVLHGVSVRLTGGKLFLGMIPPESLEELAAALQRVQLPKGDHD